MSISKYFQRTWYTQCAILYSVILGYGHISLTAESSRLFCCFYAIFGIPLCLVFLAKLGDAISKMNNTLSDKLVKWPDTDRRKQSLRLGMLTINGSIILILVPCISFSITEGWWYYEAFYYTIITLSTVGFGDYVPSKLFPYVLSYRSLHTPVTFLTL